MRLADVYRSSTIGLYGTNQVCIALGFWLATGQIIPVSFAI